VLALVLTYLSSREFHWGVFVASFLGLWIASITVQDWVGKYRASNASVWVRLKMTRSYYAMMFGHLGFALMIVGATVVSLNSEERDVRMVPGQTVELSGYTVFYQDTTHVDGPNYSAERAEVRILKGNDLVSVLYPEKRVYFSQANPMTEAGIDPGLFRDLYVALGESLGEGAWAMRIQYKPLIRWIWLGALLMSIGGLLAASDKRYRRKVSASESALKKSAVIT
jgi:cytochrome c-type biogenesis protein CcmF